MRERVKKKYLQKLDSRLFLLVNRVVDFLSAVAVTTWTISVVVRRLNLSLLVMKYSPRRRRLLPLNACDDDDVVFYSLHLKVVGQGEEEEEAVVAG